MKRVPEGDSLEHWFRRTLQPKLESALERSVIRPVQVEILERRMADLWERNRPATATARNRQSA